MAIPNQTDIPLMLIEHGNGRNERTRRLCRIDVSNLPNTAGVYVIRYKNLQINRMCGQSNILKIGSADNGIKYRFENYNHQQDATGEGCCIWEMLDDRQQKTNVWLMYFLSHWAEKDEPIVVDLYFTDRTDALERELLREYADKHHEFPPLNRGCR